MDKESPDTQPIGVADILEWAATFAMFAAWVYRKAEARGYERAVTELQAQPVEP